MALLAQQPPAPVDVIQYRFSISLSDENDTIRGEAVIRVKILKKTSALVIDLANLKKDGKGMVVNSVTSSRALDFTHENDRLTIADPAMIPGLIKEYVISYQGIPADGLIIGKNKFGRRVFFADHWPQRARQWLPCVDHPSDKASVHFSISAPAHYQVVANGIQKEESTLENGLKLTRYIEDTPLPTKVMVIGVAEFATEYAGDAQGTPVYSWVYPQERSNGFFDYSKALDILPFYNARIGPYGYKKLANVQSKTRFGGLENANTIFYHENSITGDRKCTSLLAHEIAHQWFGNMVTETDWPHIWLSEGFATYLTTVYMEESFGPDTARKMRVEDREQIIAFAARNKRPVVDSTVTDYMQLLNANSYQKGGWILHMLRNETGDSTFWKVLQTFYSSFKGKNARSEDLIEVTNAVTGKNHTPFFKQWLYQPGIPVMEVNWKYDTVSRNISLKVRQTQDSLFRFPLEFSFNPNGINLPEKRKILISKKEETFILPLPFRPATIVMDPEVKLLFQSNIKELHP
jgi:aminopeptidase N